VEPEREHYVAQMRGIDVAVEHRETVESVLSINCMYVGMVTQNPSSLSSCTSVVRCQPLLVLPARMIWTLSGTV
jgi:hypothetical protein